MANELERHQRTFGGRTPIPAAIISAWRITWSTISSALTSSQFRVPALDPVGDRCNDVGVPFGRMACASDTTQRDRGQTGPIRRKSLEMSGECPLPGAALDPLLQRSIRGCGERLIHPQLRGEQPGPVQRRGLSGP